MSNNVSLTIDKSISYTIDKALENELKQDVNLNLSQWQSVFEIVKKDKATTEKQYTGGDDDIKNGKNYVVQQGSIYQITQNAWTQIVNIARVALGKPEVNVAETEETSEPEEVVSPEAEVEENADQDAEVKQTRNNICKDENSIYKNMSDSEIITQIFTGLFGQADIEDETYQEVLAKFTNHMNYAENNNQTYTDKDIHLYVANLTQGILYKSTMHDMSVYTDEVLSDENNTNEQYEQTVEYKNPYIKTAIGLKDNNKYKTSFKNLGAGLLHAVDLNNDNKMSFKEFCQWKEDIKGSPLSEQEKTDLKAIYDTYNTNGDDCVDSIELASVALMKMQGNSSADSYSFNYDEYQNSEYQLLANDTTRKKFKSGLVAAQEYLLGEQK